MNLEHQATQKIIDEATLLLSRNEFREALPCLLPLLEDTKLKLNTALSATLNRMIAHCYWKLNKTDSAFPYYQQALEHFTALNDDVNRVEMMSKIGIYLRKKGQYETAYDINEQALAILRKLDKPTELAIVLSNQAAICLVLDQNKNAEVKFIEAIDIARSLEDIDMLAKLTSDYAKVFADRNEWELVDKCLSESIRLSSLVNDEQRIGITQTIWGSFAYSRSQWQEALTHFNEALTIHSKFGNSRLRGITLNNLGLVHRMMGNLEESDIKFQEALALHTSEDNRNSAAITKSNLADNCAIRGNLEEAYQLYLEALEIHRLTKNKVGEGMVSADIAFLLFEMNELQDSINRFKESTTILKSAGNRTEYVVALSLQSSVFARMELKEAARTSIRELELIRSETELQLTEFFYYVAMCDYSLLELSQSDQTQRTSVIFSINKYYRYGLDIIENSRIGKRSLFGWHLERLHKRIQLRYQRLGIHFEHYHKPQNWRRNEISL